MLGISDIDWIADNEAAAELRCPICGVVGPHRPLLSVPHKYTGKRLTLYRCSACDTRFYPDAIESSYDNAEGLSSAFLQHYLEAGAGLWSMFLPVALLHRGARRSLLEVGCGFGFSVDMWKSTFGDEAIGVEAAEWGQMGRNQLGIPVFRGLLDEVPQLHGRTFDIVYACEVIEHVADPRAFLKSLSAKLGPHGILVLTTPSADFIRQGNDEKDILAALSPGGHLFLLSARAFGALLKEAGFSDIHVVSARERLIAYASMEKIDLTWAQEDTLRLYLDYLRQRLERTPPGTPLHDGFAYRLFKELVLHGDLRNAAVVESLLERSLARRFGSNLSPSFWVARAKGAKNIDQWADNLPFYIGSYCFLKGELGRLTGMQPAEPLAWLEASIEIGLQSVRISPLFFTEAIHLMWAAIDRSMLLHIASNDPEKALAQFERLADARSGIAEAFQGVKPQLDAVSEAARKLLPALQAMDRADALLRFAGAVERALTSPSTDEESARTLHALAQSVDELARARQPGTQVAAADVSSKPR